jgi:hypothetical protein
MRSCEGCRATVLPKARCLCDTTDIETFVEQSEIPDFFAPWPEACVGFLFWEAQ